MKGNVLLVALTTVLSGLLAALFGSGTTSAQIGGLHPCWCCADYTIENSTNCTCTLYLENGILASPNCAIFGSSTCPFNSTKKCTLDADFREYAPCSGFYPDILIKTQCDSTKSLDTPDCNGNTSEHHTITLLCNACHDLPNGCP